MGKKVINTTLNLADNMSSKLNKIARNTQDVTKRAEQANKAYKTFSKQIGKEVLKGAQVASVAMVGIGIACSKMAMQYTAGNAKVNTIAQLNNKQLDKLGDGLLDISGKYGIAIKDVQDASYEALSSGVQANESFKSFIDRNAMTAKIGFATLEETIKGTTSVINAYGLKQTDINRITNDMIVAQNLGKTTINEMNSCMGRVLPTAHAMGINLEEVYASMASITSQGIDTSEAVTGLKTTLSNMVKPSKEAADMADALGIEFGSNAIKAKGFMGVLKGIKSKLNNVAPLYVSSANKVGNLNAQIVNMEKTGKRGKALTELKKQLKNATKEMEMMKQASKGNVEKFATMFGSVEALNTVLAMTSDQGIKLYTDSLKQMADTTDLVNKTWKKYLSDNKMQQWEIMKAKVAAVAIQFGIILLPLVIQVMNSIIQLTDWFKKLSPKDKKLIVFLAGAFIGIVAVVTVVLKSYETFKALKGLYLGIKAVGMAGVLGGLASTAGIAIIVITGLIVVGVLLWRNWDKVKESLPRIWGILGRTATNWGLMMENIWIGIKNGCIDMYNGIAGKLNFLSDKLKELTTFKVPEWIPLVGGMGTKGMDLGHVNKQVNLKYNKIGSIYAPNPKDVYKMPFKKVDKKALKARVKQYALGTQFSHAGDAIVNEKGGELRRLTNGETIIPADKSKQLIDKAGGEVNVNVTIQGNVIGNEEYMNQVGEHIAGRVKLALSNI